MKIVVVDLTNSPPFDDKAVVELFETSGHNIIAADVKAGVKRHVVLSAVGTGRMQESEQKRLADDGRVQRAPCSRTICQSCQRNHGDHP